MTFFVGQKMVCIDNTAQVSPANAKGFLAEGTVYTISRLWVDDGHSYVNIVERGNEGWDARRFRPLIERKSQTDISFALDILDRVNGKVPERV